MTAHSALTGLDTGNDHPQYMQIGAVNQLTDSNHGPRVGGNLHALVDIGANMPGFMSVAQATSLASLSTTAIYGNRSSKSVLGNPNNFASPAEDIGLPGGPAGSQAYMVLSVNSGVTGLEWALVTPPKINISSTAIMYGVTAANGPIGATDITKLCFDSTNVRLGVGGTPAHQLDVLRSSSGAIITAAVRNTSATANSSARSLLEVSGASAGDAYDLYYATSGRLFAAGLDNSAAMYTIMPAATLDTTTPGFRMTAAGNVSIGNTAPTYQLDVTQDLAGAVLTSGVRNSSNTASAGARHLIEVAGTTAADAVAQWVVAGTSTWTMGIDNSVGGAFVDPLKISRSSALGTEDYISMGEYIGYKLVHFGPEYSSTNFGSFITAGSPGAGWLGAAFYAASASTEQTAVMLATRGAAAGSDVALEFAPASGTGSGLANGGGGAKVVGGYTVSGDKYRLDFFTKKAGTYNKIVTIDGDGNVGIGAVSAGPKLLVQSAADQTLLYLNQTAGALYSSLILGSNNNQIFHYVGGGSNAATVLGQTLASSAMIVAQDSAKLVIGTSAASPLRFCTNALLRMEIGPLGNVVIGAAALATTATDGFLHLTTCPGTPTGAPTAFTGRAPLVIDTTNNKLYFYSGGAWRDAGP